MITKYVSKRWLQLETAVERVLQIFHSLQSFFLSIEDKSAKFARLYKHFKSPMPEVYLSFFQFVPQVSIKVNLLLQREDPLVSSVRSQNLKFFKSLGCKFLKIQSLAESDPQTINFFRSSRQKRWFVFITFCNYDKFHCSPGIYQKFL